MSYPASPREIPPDHIEAALDRVALSELKPLLDLDERWDRALSVGQQQRLAFARLLLHKPDWVFMDEATAALDEDNQRNVMSIFDAELKDSTVISIGHRPGLENFHRRTLEARPRTRGRAAAGPPPPGASRPAAHRRDPDRRATPFHPARTLHPSLPARHGLPRPHPPPSPTRPARLRAYRGRTLPSSGYWARSACQHGRRVYGHRADQHSPPPIRAFWLMLTDSDPANLAADLRATAASERFGCILADPPWQFTNRTGKMAPEHRRLSRYSTMNLARIRTLPVAEIAAPVSHLYLWVPNALLPDGLQVLQAWGVHLQGEPRLAQDQERWWQRRPGRRVLLSQCDRTRPVRGSRQERQDLRARAASGEPARHP